MNQELEQIRLEMKRRKQMPPKKSTSFKIPGFVYRFLLTVIITLSVLIALKSSDKLKGIFYKHVYDTHFSFALVNDWYQSYFGSPIPFQSLFKKTDIAVFEETLKYREANLFKDGVQLTVDNAYLVPLLESGMVIFVGEKEGYGKTVIVQQTNGIDVWYGNMDNLSVKLYDYVEKGKLLGETLNDKLYLVFKQDGKALDYKKYLSN